MKLINRTVMAAIVLGTMLSVGGCSDISILSALSSGQHLPADGIIVGPNEEITLNAVTAKKHQYFCSNGAVLHCDRMSLKLYCSCPAR